MFFQSKENTIRRPHRWRFLPVFFFLVIAIVLIHPPDEVRASSDVTAKVNKTTGDLTFVLTAKKASSSKTPHWKTIGFYVSKKATGQNGVEGTTASKCVFLMTCLRTGRLMKQEKMAQ